MLIYSAQLRPLSVILGNAISPKQFPPLMHRPRRFTSFWCRCASRGSIPSIRPQRLITSSEMAKQNTPPSRWMQEPNAISCKEKAVSDSTQKRSSFPETNLSASHCTERMKRFHVATSATLGKARKNARVAQASINPAGILPPHESVHCRLMELNNSTFLNKDTTTTQGQC